MLKTGHALLPGRTNHFRLRTAPAQTALQKKHRQTAHQARTLWYALHFPQLLHREQSSSSVELIFIQELAAICQQVTDHICVAGSNSLVMEVRGSLRYFRGMTGVRQTLRNALQKKLHEWQLSEFYYEALSPSGSASLLLAQSHHTQSVHHQEELRSVLGRIAVAQLPLDKKIIHRLEHCGLLYLRDIWRLPFPGLRIRFGRELSDYLEQLLALRPSGYTRWKQAVSFYESIRPESTIENHQGVLIMASELLKRMEYFLKKHHLSTDHILFVLCQDSAQQQKDQQANDQHIELSTRRHVRDKSVWLMLLENRLSLVHMSSSICSVSLRVLEFHDYRPDGAHYAESSSAGLLETLVSRLGKHAVFCLHQQEDHDPSTAGQYLPWYQGMENTCDMQSQDSKLMSRQPCWLLSPPVALTTYNRQPVYLSALNFVHGPERIETHWWSGRNIRRDYYVTCNQQGMMLWIYRDLQSGKLQPVKKSPWFLHGLFS